MSASVFIRGAAAGPGADVAEERVAKLTIHDDDDGAPADDDAAFLGRAGNNLVFLSLPARRGLVGRQSDRG